MSNSWKRMVAMGLVLLLGLNADSLMADAAPAKAEQRAEEPAPREWFVAQDGSGQYTTISEAVEQAAEGDIIWIYPGVYEESVQMSQKQLQLIGIDKDLCILQNCEESYYHPPLEIAAGSVSNLTIYAYRANTAPIGGSSTSVKDLQPELEEVDVSAVYAGAVPISSFTGYAVHIESDYAYGRSLTFSNCRIQSDCNYAVGAGLRGDYSLQFENCDFIGRGSAGDIYLHDSMENLVGETQVAFVNTRFVSELAPYFISTYSRNPENRVELTFRNVTVDAVAYQDKEIYSITNLYTGTLVDDLPAYSVEKLNLAKSQKYLGAARNLEDPLAASEAQKDKITYLKDTSLLNTMTWDQALRYDYKENPAYAGRKRTCINVWNIDGVEGDGWCGSMNFYLSPYSFFNSLPDLNYVPVVKADTETDAQTDVQTATQTDTQMVTTGKIAVP